MIGRSPTHACSQSVSEQGYSTLYKNESEYMRSCDKNMQSCDLRSAIIREVLFSSSVIILEAGEFVALSQGIRFYSGVILCVSACQCDCMRLVC